MKNKKICLSPSTLRMLHDGSHGWFNRQCGKVVPDNKYFKSGKDIEKIICDHVSGKKFDKRFADIKYKFPIVQEVDFDPRCQFKFDIDSKYSMIGYIDGRNPDEHTVVEIKTKKGLWSFSDWKNLQQRKIYTMGFPDYKVFYLITIDKEDLSNHKVYPLEPTKQDKEDAMAYIYEGIKIIESGDYTGGLDENGKCNGFCLYGKNCSFYET